jgi:uncharacterized protein (TIGR02118 family)
MSVTLLALFRQPQREGGALNTFLRRYHAEHLPLMAAVPGLRSMTVRPVTTDFSGAGHVLVNQITFDDQAALDAAMASEEMQLASENLHALAEGNMSIMVLGPAESSEDPRTDEGAA